MIEHPVKPRAISMLVDTIAAIQRTEQQCFKAIEDLRMEREINEMYQALFGDYYPDTMTDTQKADVVALVAKWDKEVVDDA